MLRFGEVSAVEISLGEHKSFGAKPTQIIIDEITSSHFTIGPLLQCGQLLTGNVAARLCIEYSLTTMYLSTRRSPKATPGIDMDHWNVCASRVSACSTSLAEYFSVLPNSFTAIKNGRLRRSKKSTSTKRFCRRSKV